MSVLSVVILIDVVLRGLKPKRLFVGSVKVIVLIRINLNYLKEKNEKIYFRRYKETTSNADGVSYGE